MEDEMLNKFLERKVSDCEKKIERLEIALETLKTLKDKESVKKVTFEEYMESVTKKKQFHLDCFASLAKGLHKLTFGKEDGDGVIIKGYKADCIISNYFQEKGCYQVRVKTIKDFASEKICFIARQMAEKADDL